MQLYDHVVLFLQDLLLIQWSVKVARTATQFVSYIDFNFFANYKNTPQPVNHLSRFKII